jgi:peptidoglycan hydrolase CwlO-like protein
MIRSMTRSYLPATNALKTAITSGAASLRTSARVTELTPNEIKLNELKSRLGPLEEQADDLRQRILNLNEEILAMEKGLAKSSEDGIGDKILNMFPLRIPANIVKNILGFGSREDAQKHLHKLVREQERLKGDLASVETQIKDVLKQIDNIENAQRRANEKTSQRAQDTPTIPSYAVIPSNATTAVSAAVRSLMVLRP